MRKVLPFIALVIIYSVFVVPFSRYMMERPIAVKVGYLPDAKIVKLLVADQRYLFAQYAVGKVLIYYGTLVDKLKQKVVVVPEHEDMFGLIKTATILDPYNMDAYYFAQAIFSWEGGRYKDVNSLMDYGMNYRQWDYQLPFFAGFNSAYFLKDYSSAANYMKIAAERSRNPLLANLAARYLYESGQSEFGIFFLEMMMNSTFNPKIKAMYELRINALKAITEIKRAIENYVSKTGTVPKHLGQLVETGIILAIPKDPYGGEFYLDRDGVVRTTSKFVMKVRGQ